MTSRKKTVPRPFDEARVFARNLGLNSRGEWEDFVSGRIPGLARPVDMPRKPNLSYRYEGWSGYADWLGIEIPGRSRFRHFQTARHFVRSLGITSIKAWNHYCWDGLPGKGPKPADIPSSPNHTYADKGWISWNDWFGCGVVEYQGRTYEPFTDARKFARALGLPDVRWWFDYCNGKLHGRPSLPDNIPVFPYEVYRGYGWAGWNDWLGRRLPPKHERRYRSFNEARDFVRALKLDKNTLWRKYCRGEIINREPVPDDIPASPEKVYAGEWISWGDWLGTGSVSNMRRSFRSFIDARDFVRKLGLRNEDEWRRCCREGIPGKGRLPSDIPTNPHRSYSSEWQGMGDWLGTGFISNQKKKFLPFGKARAFARKLRLKNAKEWCRRSKDFPVDIPRYPDSAYRLKGWISWGDWLGTGAVAATRRNFLPFKEARTFARALGLKNIFEWRSYARGEIPEIGRKPDNIPANADQSYKSRGDWKGWKDFLGNGDRK